MNTLSMDCAHRVPWNAASAHYAPEIFVIFEIVCSDGIFAAYLIAGIMDHLTLKFEGD